MTDKNTISLFEFYNNNFNEYFDEFYLKLRERANLISIQLTNPEEMEKNLNSDMKDIYYSNFFIDILGYIELADISSTRPSKSSKHYSTADIKNYFESTDIKGSQKIRDIISKVFADYKDIAIKLVAPLWTLMDSQDELIKKYIKIIEDRNGRNMDELERNYLEKIIQLLNIKNSSTKELEDDDFLFLSKQVKNELIAKSKIISQEDFTRGMEKFIKTSRNTLRSEINRRFKMDFSDWLDKL
jgi:hypothetical protein